MDNNNTFTNIEQLLQLVRGSGNSQSLAMLNSVMAETVGMSMYNAVSSQHNAQILNSASTTSTCARILSVKSPEHKDKIPEMSITSKLLPKNEDNDMQW